MSYAGYECLVTINGTGISGASISSFSTSSNLAVITKLGASRLTRDNRGKAFPAGFSVSRFSVTKPLCISGGEPLKNLIDSTGFFSGTIQTDSDGIIFTSGMATKYSVNYSLDEGPNATLEVLIFGEINEGRVENPVFHSGDSYFARRSYVNLDISGAEGDITQFSYSFDRERTPLFQWGEYYPVACVSSYTRFSFNAQGYITGSSNFQSNMYESLQSPENVYLDLTTYGGDGTVLIDRQTGLFAVESRDVSISVDDEYSFGLSAVLYY